MALKIDLEGKRALITGVSSGIGLGIAGMMAEAGCNIAGCALDEPESDGVKKFFNSVEPYDRDIYYQKLDLCDHTALQDWVTTAASQLNGIDIVISNAGRNIFKGATDCKIEDWNEAMNLDLAVHWKLAQATRPYLLKAKQPVIIAIASNHAYYTIPGCFPYNVAKAGVVALVQSLAIEWGPHIRTVGIAPGFIDTRASVLWFDSFPDPIAERTRTEAMHPVGKIGTPQEIGGLCAFLCSSFSNFISGTTLLVDGGRSALMQDS